MFNLNKILLLAIVLFAVTGSSISYAQETKKKTGVNIGAICSYPAPPMDCNYVEGPNFNPINQCGLVLQCGNIDSPVKKHRSIKSPVRMVQTSEVTNSCVRGA